MKGHKNAIVLCSGGLDSATVMAVARNEGFDIYALSFRYGQRHDVELEAARRVVQHTGVTDYWVLDIDLGRMGGLLLIAGRLRRFRVFRSTLRAILLAEDRVRHLHPVAGRSPVFFRP